MAVSVVLDTDLALFFQSWLDLEHNLDTAKHFGFGGFLFYLGWVFCFLWEFLFFFFFSDSYHSLNSYAGL